jgi:hypothetical protein
MDKMYKSLLRLALLFMLALKLILSPWLGAFEEITAARAQSNANLPEGNDFATLVLRDPWEMSEFSDISQYLNQSGQVSYLEDIRVADGIFSARSSNLKDAQFFALWPGYNTAMMIDKIGNPYPIDAGKYRCLYLGMKVDTSLYYDQFQVMWFADETLNGGVWGFSKFVRLYPEAQSGSPSHNWRLYKLDLSSSDAQLGGTPWNDRGDWRGLRIDPTHEGSVDFAIDWIRLTDCQPVTQEISWSGSQSASIWVRPEGAGREFLVEPNAQGNSYNLDVQGIPPGSYTFLVKNGSTVLESGDFFVNQTPIARFARPSFTSGEDYATAAGNPWDFSDGSDVSQINDMSASFSDGVIKLETPPGTTLDPILELNSPRPIAHSGDYRYLSFRMYTAGEVQNVPEGMIARWIWRIPGSSGRPGFECHLVGHDIPFDVGWKTYTVDLSDPFNGLAEETAGECSGLPKHWLDSSPVLSMRFDPNETIMDQPMNQQIDWMLLTKPDQVVKGQAFPIQISLNKPPQEIKEVTFYYTDDLSQPTKFPAEAFSQAASTGASPETVAPESGQVQFAVNSRIFLPMSLRNYSDLKFTPVPNGVNFGWNTASVSPGEYHVCAVVEDSYNQATYCSEAAMQVIAP